MNMSRNLVSLLAVGAAPGPPPSTVPTPRLPAGRLTSSVRRGLSTLGWAHTTDYNRRDLTAAMRWLSS